MANDDFYNANTFRRRRQGEDVELNMAAKGRSLSAAGYRYRSAPGAPHSARDAMADLTGGVGERPATGGLSSASRWDSFFAPSQTETAARNIGPSLAPATVPDAAAMAAAMPKGPRTPDQYVQAAITSSEQWLDASGSPRPAASTRNPATSGTSFANKYGTGSVLSGEDYRAKLKRMAGAGGFETAAI